MTFNLRVYLLYGLMLCASFILACAGSSNQQADTARGPGDVPTVKEPPAPPPFDWKTAKKLEMECEPAIDLQIPLFKYASNLEAQQIPYAQAQDAFADCSGMFLRMIDSLKQSCPDFTYPNRNTHRQTRELAQWYAEQGHFVRIQDPIAADSLIKPGAVLFYGRPGATGHDTLPLADLFTRQKGIFHMGIVVDVEYDEEGVKNLHLFHGRTTGRPAAITKYHPRNPSRGNPAFGNGSEAWVAAAPIIHPAE